MEAPVLLFGNCGLPSTDSSEQLHNMDAVHVSTGGPCDGRGSVYLGGGPASVAAAPAGVGNGVAGHDSRYNEFLTSGQHLYLSHPGDHVKAAIPAQVPTVCHAPPFFLPQSDAIPFSHHWQQGPPARQTPQTFHTFAPSAPAPLAHGLRGPPPPPPLPPPPYPHAVRNGLPLPASGPTVPDKDVVSSLQNYEFQPVRARYPAGSRLSRPEPQFPRTLEVCGDVRYCYAAGLVDFPQREQSRQGKQGEITRRRHHSQHVQHAFPPPADRQPRYAPRRHSHHAPGNDGHYRYDSQPRTLPSERSQNGRRDVDFCQYSRRHSDCSSQRSQAAPRSRGGPRCQNIPRFQDVRSDADLYPYSRRRSDSSQRETRRISCDPYSQCHPALRDHSPDGRYSATHLYTSSRRVAPSEHFQYVRRDAGGPRHNDPRHIGHFREYQKSQDYCPPVYCARQEHVGDFQSTHPTHARHVIPRFCTRSRKGRRVAERREEFNKQNNGQTPISRDTSNKDGDVPPGFKNKFRRWSFSVSVTALPTSTPVASPVDQKPAAKKKTQKSVYKVFLTAPSLIQEDPSSLSQPSSGESVLADAGHSTSSSTPNTCPSSSASKESVLSSTSSMSDSVSTSGVFSLSSSEPGSISEQPSDAVVEHLVHPVGLRADATLTQSPLELSQDLASASAHVRRLTDSLTGIDTDSLPSVFDADDQSLDSVFAEEGDVMCARSSSNASFSANANGAEKSVPCAESSCAPISADELLGLQEVPLSPAEENWAETRIVSTDADCQASEPDSLICTLVKKLNIYSNWF